MLKRLSPLARALIFSGIIALIMILLVWFLGPRYGLGRSAVLIVTASVIALWLLIAAILYIVGRKSKRQPAAHYGSDWNVSGSGESAVLGERLDRAIRWLRKSKMAESGRDVVYDLPWYLLAGPPGSGKSTWILQSGLNFPYTDPKKTAGKLKLDATADCDLWVANEALFIDPSGSFYAGNREALSCLSMLSEIKQRRREKPIDGIILIVDIAGIFNLDNAGLRSQADKLRAFLDATMKEFGMIIPIYLLFSKSDLIEGFQEFFSKPEERENQVLGATFTREQYQSQSPEKVFQQEFDRLCQSARFFGTARLPAEKMGNRSRTYPFPKQMSLMRDRLTEFVGILFQHSQFREKPLFRGFYFTSGIQEERPLDFVARLMHSKTGLPVKADSTGTHGTQSFFIKTLLTQVILPDKNLAGLSFIVRRRRILKRIVLACAAGIVLPLIILLLFWGAYRDNRQLVEAVEQARQIPVDNGKSSENLVSLENLREHLEEFECRGKLETCRISGRRFHWGMYAGEETLNEARAAYVGKLRQLFLDEIVSADTALGNKFNGLKTQLRMMASTPGGKTTGSEPDDFDPGRAYTLLKTVMMLSDEKKASPFFLTDQLLDYWILGVQEKDLQGSENLLRFYLHQLGDHHNPAYSLSSTSADKEMAQRIREKLMVVEPVVYYYGIIQEEGGHKINLVNLTAIAGVENAGLFDAGVEVSGTYTKMGWEQLVRDRIEEMKSDYETERSWVLGTMASEPGQLKINEKLQDQYFRDYADSWWNFLKSIDIVPFVDFSDASGKLVVLSDSGKSPIARFLKTASLNTWEDPEEPDAGTVTSIENMLEGKPEGQVRLAEEFKPLHNFVLEKEGQTSPLVQYLNTLSNLQVVIKSFLDAGQPAPQIQEIGKEAENALRVTNGLLVNFDSRSRESVEPLLKHPIQLVLKLVDHATPVGKAQERKRTLSVSGVVRDKDKTRDGVIVALLESYEDNDYKSDKEIMRAQTSDGAFRFTSPINPGKYKICTSEDKESYYCGDVRLDRDNDGKTYELQRPRSRLLFGGGKRELTLNIR